MTEAPDIKHARAKQLVADCDVVHGAKTPWGSMACTDVANYVRALEAERDRYLNAVTQIAAFTDPDDMVEGDDGLTEWGCSYSEAVEMSYDNVLGFARAALNQGGQSDG